MIWAKLLTRLLKDILYIAFQASAQTSINKIITSVPIDFENDKKYYYNYKKIFMVTLDNANQIMHKEFGSADYSVLFINSGRIQIPSQNFDKLKFKNLNIVYSKLLK